MYTALCGIAAFLTEAFILRPVLPTITLHTGITTPDPAYVVLGTAGGMGIGCITDLCVLSTLIAWDVICHLLLIGGILTTLIGGTPIGEIAAATGLGGVISVPVAAGLYVAGTFVSFLALLGVCILGYPSEFWATFESILDQCPTLF